MPANENIVHVWPKCGVEHDVDFADEAPDAVALAPQSFDGGVTVDTWIPVCGAEIATWWDGGDWMGTFAWLSKEVV